MDELKDKSYQDYETHDENPFMKGLAHHLSKNNRNKMVRTKVVSQDDGDHDKLTGLVTDHEQGDMIVGDLQVVDSEKFTKIYHEAIQLTHGLSDKATKILMWYIAPKLGKDQTQVIFNLEECMEFIGYSRPSIYSGLAELLDVGVIAKSELNWLFYIDPAIMFNGDRLEVAKVYLREGSNKAQAARKLAESYGADDELPE
jgi:hypothetical protein